LLEGGCVKREKITVVIVKSKEALKIKNERLERLTCESVYPQKL
jgi:hypothetical protein